MREIDVRDLIRHPGSSRVVHVDEPVEGFRMALAEVPAGAPLRGELLLESVVEGILVSGPISGKVAFRCARCLKDLERQLTVEVQEMFVVGAGSDDDEYRIDPSGLLDPEPMVRDAVLLSMPFSPLCRPDCLGLCERCGGDRNLGECTCLPEDRDPRWAVLDRVFEQSSD
jgi:uncharacterized protein